VAKLRLNFPFVPFKLAPNPPSNSNFLCFFFSPLFQAFFNQREKSTVKRRVDAFKATRKRQTKGQTCVKWNLVANRWDWPIINYPIATHLAIKVEECGEQQVGRAKPPFPVASAWPAGQGLFPILILFMTSSNCSAVELGNKLSAEGIRGTAASVLHLKLCKCWLGWWTGTMGWMSCGGWALSIPLGFRWVVWGPQWQLNALANADFAWV